MTIEDLQELAEKERDRQRQFKCRLLYCSAAGCVSCGSKTISEALTAAIKERGLGNEVEAVGTGCMGLCGAGPLV